VASAFQVHCPSFQSLVLATRCEVLARPARDPSSLTTDTRDELSGACFVALRGERFDGHQFLEQAAQQGAALAVVERAPDSAVMARLPQGFGLLRVSSTRAALGAIAHAWRTSLRALRVVAVTGSAGKTTTRRLLEGMLAEVGPTQASAKSFNNDIGVPLTLLSTPDACRFLVAEIGMNHPGEILPLTEMAMPEVAIITLAGRAHLEGLGSVEAVAKEKASILAGTFAHGVGVVNGDNPPLMHAVRELVDAGRAPERIVTFGQSPACDYRLLAREQGANEQRIEIRFRRPVAPSLEATDASEGESMIEVIGRRTRGATETLSCTLRMSGEHNARNAVAAFAAAVEMGVAPEVAVRGLATVAAADMRLERIELAGRTIYNDAYNANPDAMIASLAAFSELARDAVRRAAILGEMRELGEGARGFHEEVGEYAGRTLSARDALVAVGPHAAALVAAARRVGFTGDALHAEVFDDALALEAARFLPAGTAVLLKGSRGARMERFLKPIEASFAREA
jgi:UDP-N-acetylmuramoyl-tripeptide--D-alanyl-D-alanine ligase